LLTTCVDRAEGLNSISLPNLKKPIAAVVVKPGLWGMQSVSAGINVYGFSHLAKIDDHKGVVCMESRKGIWSVQKMGNFFGLHAADIHFLRRTTAKRFSSSCKYLFSIIKGCDNDIKRTEDLKEDIYSGGVLPL
jgi:hypothetical protein